MKQIIVFRLLINEFPLPLSRWWEQLLPRQGAPAYDDRLLGRSVPYSAIMKRINRYLSMGTSNTTNGLKLEQLKLGHLTQAEQQLSQAGNDTVSLYTLSTNPNQTVTVEPILYRALERFCATGSRAIYYGPLYSRYYALFASQYDEAAAEYDPARSSDAGAFAAQIAAFAQNPDQIDLELLGENQVRLNVGKEYLAYARENELDTLLDFGFVKNAFVIDAVADALTDAGLTLSGLSPDGRLVETVELSDRAFFVGVQYHPEFKSRPNKAHPLFRGFIAAALDEAKKR